MVLTSVQIAEYRDSFSIFDTDGDGTISVFELRTVMANLGRNISDRELNEIVASADKDQNGTIDFGEFLDLMENQAERSSSDEELLAAFQVFDRDGSGNISLEELTDVMRSLGEKLSKAELREMMREADEDGDGEINFREFRRMMVEFSK